MLSDVYPEDGGLFEQGKRAGYEIAAAYEECDFARAMRTIMALADRANEYLDQKQPWRVKKEPGREQDLVAICTVALNIYRQIVIYLTPVLPRLAEASALLLRSPLDSWDAAEVPLLGQPIGTFQHLMQRVDPNQVQAMIDEENAAREQERAAAGGVAVGGQQPSELDDGCALAAEPIAETCTIDDFGRVDLRVARVLSAEQVKEAKKLLKLTVTLGGDDRRTIFAGIKAAYDPQQLEGRLVLVVANLAPRQMKFGLSEGMVLCAGEGGADLYVLSPDSGAQVGQRVR